MWGRDQIVEELRRRGELWECAPGLIALRGDVLALRNALAAALRTVAMRSAADEWCLPPALPLDTLRRADYFASFPQWLTTATHLSDDEDALRAVAEADGRKLGSAVESASLPAHVALQPAACYHVYTAWAGRIADQAECVTCEGTCWRHEGRAACPLERGWAFTMREVVCAGGRSAVDGMLATQRAAALMLAARLGLDAEIEVAEDPFFAPTARGRALMQRLRALKHELRLPAGNGRTVAAASFNHHEGHFSTAFDITLPGGEPAVTGCAAYGIERWLLAVLAVHGVDAGRWPDPATAMDGRAKARRPAPVHPALREAS
ncbi:MAG TPA: hypothetical protein VK929_01910 [Longimicrobiales bacterium]|nr:hypothetical protein [Longimicrobiales bacterium]